MRLAPGPARDRADGLKRRCGTVHRFAIFLPTLAAMAGGRRGEPAGDRGAQPSGADLPERKRGRGARMAHGPARVTTARICGDEASTPHKVMPIGACLWTRPFSSVAQKTRDFKSARSRTDETKRRERRAGMSHLPGRAGMSPEASHASAMFPASRDCAGHAMFLPTAPTVGPFTARRSRQAGSGRNPADEPTGLRIDEQDLDDLSVDGHAEHGFPT